jgi:hypothetical protein
MQHLMVVSSADSLDVKKVLRSFIKFKLAWLCFSSNTIQCVATANETCSKMLLWNKMHMNLQCTVWHAGPLNIAQSKSCFPLREIVHTSAKWSNVIG